MDLTWTSKVTLPGSHGPGSATINGLGKLEVDTPEGGRDVVMYEVRTELEANGTNQATVTITHPASGVKLTTVGRMGDRGVAAITGTTQGSLDVGPASIMPLSLTLADGTTKTWEVVPQAWSAGFESTGLPWNLFPFMPRNIWLTHGVNHSQNPASLRNGIQINALGVIDTFGANAGIGSSP